VSVVRTILRPPAASTEVLTAKAGSVIYQLGESALVASLAPCSPFVNPERLNKRPWPLQTGDLVGLIGPKGPELAVGWVALNGPSKASLCVGWSGRSQQAPCLRQLDPSLLFP